MGDELPEASAVRRLGCGWLPNQTGSAAGQGQRKAVRSPLIGSALLLAVYAAVLVFSVAPGRSGLQRDTAFCKAWAEEIWRFGRAYYAIDEASSTSRRSLTVSVPKPLVILAALLLRPLTAAPWTLRVLCVAAWGATLSLLWATWGPRSFWAGVVLVLPAALSSVYIHWANIAQASTLYTLLVIGAALCATRVTAGSEGRAYVAGVLLLLAGLARPAAWFLPIVAAAWLLKRRELPAVHAILGPCVALLAPIIWMVVDYEFSGDFLWSSHTVGTHWARGFDGLSRFGGVRVNLGKYGHWLVVEMGHPLLALALVGVVALAVRKRGSWLLFAFATVELVAFAAGTFMRLAGFTPRFVPVVTLMMLFAAGGVVALLCESAAKVNKWVGLVLCVALMAGALPWLGGGVPNAIRRYELFISEEPQFIEAADVLARRIKDGDIVIVATGYIPAMAARMELYPMVKWFRGTDTGSALDRCLSEVISGWLVISDEVSPRELKVKVRRMAARPRPRRVVFCERLKGGTLIYRIRERPAAQRKSTRVGHTAAPVLGPPGTAGEPPISGARIHHDDDS